MDEETRALYRRYREWADAQDEDTPQIVAVILACGFISTNECVEAIQIERDSLLVTTTQGVTRLLLPRKEP